MRKVFPIMLLMLILLAACAPQAQPTESAATDLPSSATEVTDAVADMLVDRLAVNLALEKSEITVKSVREVEFGDSCLDAPIDEMACAQVVTAGRIYLLEANGIEYEYHTDEVGDVIRPASLGLTWTREGGIAGFCDKLIVFLSGEVYASNCKSDPPDTSGTFAELLSAAQQAQFHAWYEEYGESSINASDPKGVSDRMIITLAFHGSGADRPGKVAQQAMLNWAMKLYQKLSS